MPPKAAGLLLAATILTLASPAAAADPVRTTEGVVDGLGRQASGVRIFEGIPYARPPVGPLRWSPPGPAVPHKGILKAQAFGPRCMQQPLFADMVFRTQAMGEDCLYLNVWTPARARSGKLPVLVYIYGGGYRAGDGSEPRYDGESLAAKGMVVVTLNYRLGVFGFLAHPELTAQSPHHASGNYGILDQVQALRWVKANAAAFGGDPNHIVVGGESAGAYSVSALMMSPLSKGMLAGAIAESGSIAMLQPIDRLADAETAGLALGKTVGAPSLADLRAMTAQQLLDASAKIPGRVVPVIDGWVLPKSPVELYAAGEGSKAPLLIGSNSQENPASAVLRDKPATVAGYREALAAAYGPRADQVFAAYPAATDSAVTAAAQALASDRFIAWSTWKWFDLHRKSGAPTYYYYYAKPRPVARATPAAAPPTGAVHSGEIEYALGNLDRNSVFAWTPADREVSRIMQGWFANFVKRLDPNGPGLPPWPAAGKAASYPRETIAETSSVAAFPDERYRVLERASAPR